MKSGVLFVFLFCAACSVAPFSNMYTGHSLGQGHHGIDLAIIDKAAPAARYMYGIQDNVDIGLLYDAINAGVVGRYSFVNQQENGFSAGAVGSLGKSPFGTYWFIGPAASYRCTFRTRQALEPYAVVRYNQISYNGEEVNLGSLGAAKISAGSYHYFYYTLGAFFWFTDWIGAAGEVSSSSGEEIKPLLGSTIWVLGLAFRF